MKQFRSTVVTIAIDQVLEYHKEHKKYPKELVFTIKALTALLGEADLDSRVGAIKIGDECTIELKVNRAKRSFALRLLGE